MQNLQIYLVSLRFLCAAHTLHCLRGCFLFPSPPPTNFSSLCILKSLKGLPGGSCLVPLGVVHFSGNWRSSELDSLQFWTSDIQDLPTLCRKILFFTFLFVFSVLYTKNLLKRAQFSRYNTTFFDHFSFPQNWVKTEVLVCPVYTLYEFIVLANSIRLLYFHACFPVFPPFVYNCCVMDRTYHSHKSSPSKCAPLCHHSSERWLLFFQVLAFLI